MALDSQTNLNMSNVDVGFIEKSEKHILQSNHFPSKIGGKPSWLTLKDIPSAEDLKCALCSQPLIFLAQVYAPFEEDDNNFHRTIFIFICRNPECCKKNESTNIKVWRSQLSRKNEFYSYEPPNENDESIYDIEKYLKLCYVCGCSASKHCSKCKIAAYCSREHQISDWKSGHKVNCQNSNNIEYSNPTLFEEFELVIEEEELEKKSVDNEEKQMQEYEKLVAEGKTGTLNDISEDELQSHASLDGDKVFLQFKKRISKEPDQVLRYERGGEPLWVSAEPKPSDIPKCEYCGCERQFEFQILPQLLYGIKEDKLDWGVIVVYTCKKSCVSEICYKKEFVFKQDIS